MRIFSIGIGKDFEGVLPVMSLKIDEKCSKRSIFLLFAATCETASETAKIALAPSFDLSLVPSRSIIILSISACFFGSRFIIAGAIVLLIFVTAFWTPLPK